MKENRAFRIFFYYHKVRNRSQALHGNFQSYISMHPVSNAPSFSKISQPQGQNQQNGKQCCLPPLSFKIDLWYTSFKILRAIPLSRMLVEFSPTCIFHHVWGNFLDLWCSHS